jgi:hypothetical protein
MVTRLAQGFANEFKWLLIGSGAVWLLYFLIVAVALGIRRVRQRETNRHSTRRQTPRM